MLFRGLDSEPNRPMQLRVLSQTARNHFRTRKLITRNRYAGRFYQDRMAADPAAENN